MSAPNETNNPWVTLAELLKSGFSEAVLATSIEKVGIQVYDRFGRRVTANDEGSNHSLTKARALDLLAEHYAYLTKTHMPEELASDTLISEESDFYEFGWPKDEIPNLDDIESEITPRIIRGKKSLDLDATARLQKHRSYLVVINALLRINKSHPKNDPHIVSKIVKNADLFKVKISEDTVRNMFNDIAQVIEDKAQV